MKVEDVVPAGRNPRWVEIYKCWIC